MVIVYEMIASRLSIVAGQVYILIQMVIVYEMIAGRWIGVVVPVPGPPLAPPRLESSPTYPPLNMQPHMPPRHSHCLHRYTSFVYSELVFLNLPVIRDRFSFPNLEQETSSLYVYKELRLKGTYFHGPDEFLISGF